MLSKRIIRTNDAGGGVCTSDITDIFGDGSGVALYQLNWDGSDMSGNYNGTATDVSFVNGKINEAGSFNGSSSYIPTGLDNFFNQKRNCTVSLWFKAGSLSNANGYLFIDYSGYNNCGIKIKSNGTIGVDTFYGSGARDTVTTGTYNDDNWHHIAVSIDTAANTRKTYVDTVLVLNDTLPSGTFSVTAGFFAGFGVLGNPNPISQYYFKGNIDQARIFNKALSAGEVTTLYNEVACEKTCTTNDNQLVSDCIAYYKMDGNADDALNTYDGTPTNVSWTQGRFGSAGGFNGSSSYVDTNYTVGAISAYSVSTWIKTTSTARQIIFSDYNSAGEGLSTRASLGISASSKFEFVLGNGSDSWSDNTSIDASSYLDGNWHNLNLVISGTSVKLYANGNSTPIANFTSSISAGTAGTQSINLGRAGDYNGLYFNGSIDQVRIYDRAITAAEVTTLYNEVQCPSTASFNTVLYTGTGSTQNVGGVGFQPDFVWIKNRDTAISHALFDVVRGTPLMLRTDLTNEEVDNDNDLQLFTDEGFVVGLNTRVNQSNADMVAWCWKAGGAAVTNTDGTITSQVSANVDAGFSVVSFTSGSFGSTYGHGLGSAPKMYFLKRRDAATDWPFYTTVIDGSLDVLFLNKTNAKIDTSPAPTDSVFTLNDNAGFSYIAYCFAEVAGFSKFGSYTGNGTTSNNIVTGFEPAFVMIKRTDLAGYNWNIFDNKRGNGDYILGANTSSSEETSLTPLDFNSNGFNLTTSGNYINFLDGNYIYMAFANQF